MGCFLGGVFEVEVIVAQFLSGYTRTPPTPPHPKLAGGELGTVPGSQTTGQLTPTTGEAGLGHRARLETSDVPFIEPQKEPQHRSVAQ